MTSQIKPTHALFRIEDPISKTTITTKKPEAISSVQNSIKHLNHPTSCVKFSAQPCDGESSTSSSKVTQSKGLSFRDALQENKEDSYLCTGNSAAFRNLLIVKGLSITSLLTSLVIRNFPLKIFLKSLTSSIKPFIDKLINVPESKISAFI